MSYDVVPYAPALHDEIVRLQTHLWSTDPQRNAAYFKWKYADNPCLPGGLLRVALSDGRAVAMRGVFGARWEADGGTVGELPYADDFVVEPAHRNSGIARRVLDGSIADAAGQGFRFAVNLSAGPVTYLTSLAAGWRAAGSFGSVRRDRPAPPRWLRRIDRLRRGTAANVFDRLDRRAGRSPEQLTLSAAARPEDMAALVRRLPWDGRIRHVRDARWLGWRFGNPLHEYRFLYWDEGGLRGYLVLQRYLAEGGDRLRVNISDWEADDEHVRAGLLEQALRWGDFDRVHVWAAGAGEPLRTLLHRHGFSAEDQPGGGVRAHSSGVLVRRLAVGVDEPWLLGGRNLLDIADWDLRLLYSMAG